MIVMLRIDYRLLHWQTGVLWCKQLKVNHILIANDAVANDEMRKSIMKMMQPQGVKLSFLTMDDALLFLNSKEASEERIEVLVDNSDDAMSIVDKIEGIEKVNAAIMKKEDGKKMVNNSLALGSQDIDNFRKMIRKGLKVESFLTPTDSIVNVEKWLK